jgi:hypothetical protein
VRGFSCSKTVQAKCRESFCRGTNGLGFAQIWIEAKGGFMNDQLNKTQKYAYVSGVLFILMGILGFFPGVTVVPHVHDPNLIIETSYGRLLGLFPVNVLHNLAHIAIGVWALFAAADASLARMYCRGSAIIYGVLALMGIIPGFDTVFGLIPLHSHDIWLHAGIACVAAYFGWAKSSVRVHAPSDRETRAWT